MWEMGGSCRSHGQFYYAISIGRVFFPILACPLWLFVKTVHDLCLGRLINVGMLSISAFFFCQWLRKHSISPVLSWLVTLTLFTLPTFQTQVDLVNSFPHTVGVLASIGAGFMAWRGAQVRESFFNRYTFLATALTFFSMSISTALSTFYFPVIAVPLILSSDWKDWRGRRLLHLFGPFFVAAALYLPFAKLTYTFVPFWFKIPKSTVLSWGHRVAITRNIPRKIPLFLNAFYIALNLWNILLSYRFALVTAAVLLSGAALGFVDLLKRADFQGPARGRAFLKGLLILSLFPLAMLPNLTADFYLLSYRMISALCALTVVALFFAIRKLCFTFLGRIGNFAVGLVFLFFAVTGIYKAQSNLRNFIVAPTQAELKYIQSVLQKNDLREVRRIHVIRPNPGNFLGASRNLPTCDDEFGLLTSTFRQNVPGLIRCVLRESGLGTDAIRKIKISSGLYYKSGMSRPHMIVVDMKKLYNELYKNFIG